MQPEDPNHGRESGSPTILVRAIGVYAALFLLLILVVGCGGQSGTTDKEEKAKQQTTTEPDPKSEPTPKTDPNKRAVAIKGGSLRDLVQEQVGDFDLQGVEDAKRDLEKDFGKLNAVEALEARYVGPGGASLSHILITMRSPESADDIRQGLKTAILGGSEEDVPENWEDVDERPVEASGRRVGTVTVIPEADSGTDAGTLALWNNGNLVALAAIEKGESDDAYESFYKSVAY